MGNISYMDLTLSEFVVKTASDAPAPGGGSVSALSAALGAALACMVARLTIGRSGYENAEAAMQSAALRAETASRELLYDIQKDSESFLGYMAALKLPKNTEDEKAARREAMQRALKEAAEQPLSVAQKAVDLMELAEETVRLGNKNAVTDGLSAALLLRCAVRCALMNVKINLNSIRDEAYTNHFRTVCREIEQKAALREAAILALVPELA